MHHYFITGTSQGIGKALVERALQDDNNQVYGFSRSQSIEHPRYAHTSIDLSDIASLTSQVDQLFPSLEGAEKLMLINNAGTLGEVKYLGDLDDERIAQLFNLNLTAPTVLINHFIRAYQDLLVEKLIINVSSGAGKYPVDGWSGYCASKAALDMVSQVVALELEKKGQKRFKVFALAPGVVDTRMQGEIRTVDAQHFSNLDKFKQYKANRELDDPAYTADKFFQLIQQPDQFEEVLQDVRKF